MTINSGTNGFNLYTAGDPVMAYKSGRSIFVAGAMTPKGASSEDQTMFTLPAGMRPPKNFTELNQGSGSSTWNITVQTNGAVVLERYNGTLSAGNWLTFSFAFVSGE